MTKKAKKTIENPLVQFENKWVALSRDQKTVVAFGVTLKELDRKLAKLNDKESIITKVLPFNLVFSP